MKVCLSVPHHFSHIPNHFTTARPACQSKTCILPKHFSKSAEKRIFPFYTPSDTHRIHRAEKERIRPEREQIRFSIPHFDQNFDFMSPMQAAQRRLPLYSTRATSLPQKRQVG
jgi:hypothetical protein